MPEVSRFFGIVIAMYHDEHPPPHFHARYGGKKITVEIADGRVAGRLPPRALGLVLEWWSLHQPELAENWELVIQGKQPNQIAPLE
jgi:phosphomannomutase